MVETEPFIDTFGPKAQRKRPRIDVGTFEELRKLSGAVLNTLVLSSSNFVQPLLEHVRKSCFACTCDFLVPDLKKWEMEINLDDVSRD
jgi:hypothetical protein